jgi:hypothetical protein
MKKIIIALICLFAITGCAQHDTTAVVVTSDLLGTGNGTATLVNTDDLTALPVSISLSTMDLPNMVVVSPDSTKAYVASAHYPFWAVGSNKVQVIDIKTKAITKTITVDQGLILNNIFDIGLNPSGSRLYIGSWTGFKAYIDIYDTATMESVGSFDTDEGVILPPSIDSFRFAWKLAVHPTLDVVYVLAANGIDARVRAYSTTDGTLIGGMEYPIANSGIANLLDYKLAISPEGDLLLALSSKTFPFAINEDGSLSVLYDTNADGISEGIDWQAKDNASLFGKTDILFTKTKGVIYINSSGIHIDPINLAGGSVCMSKAKILAEDANPYIYSLTDFIDDVLPWIVNMLGYPVISDIIDPTQLYGISASAMVDNTCFMFIAPIISIETADLTIPNIFVVFNSVFKGFTPFWVGGMTTTTYANNLAVSPSKTTLCLTNKWAKSMDVWSKDPILGWAKMTKKGTIDFGDDTYPRTLGMASLPKPSPQP